MEILLNINLLYWSNSRKTKVELFTAKSADSNDSLPSFSDDCWVLEENTIFTCYYLWKNRYPIEQTFWICRAGSEVENQIKIADDKWISGKFEIIVEGDGNLYAKRLKDWWNAGDRSEKYARLCAQYLKPRITKIPEHELTFLSEPQPQPTDAVLGGMSAQPRPFDAVLGGKRPINN